MQLCKDLQIKSGSHVESCYARSTTKVMASGRRDCFSFPEVGVKDEWIVDGRLELGFHFKA